MRNSFPLKLAAAVLFSALLILGLRLASQKPLWNDEIYSQIASVEGLSYRQILKGNISEGHNTPLFYVIQKIVCAAAGYHAPEEWRQGTQFWGFDRPMDRILLRVGPVVFVALAIVAIFYYFAKFHSWPAGFYSLLISLSSGMLWQYWAEARPYALWIFLTTLQLLLFLSILRNADSRPASWRRLAAVHLALSVTAILSLPQILIVSVLLGFYKRKDWKAYLLPAFIPVGLCLFYYLSSPKYHFLLQFSVEQYIRANISRDRLYILLLYGVTLGVYALRQKIKTLRVFLEDSILAGAPFGVLLGGMIFSASVTLFVLKGRELAGESYFPVTEKYFIHLMPAGIVGTVLFSDAIVRAFRKHVWVSIVMAGGIAALVIPRFFKVMHDILKQYPHLIS